MPIEKENLNMLKEIIGDDLKEVIESYLAASPNLLQQMQICINSEDADGIQLHSHTLKGASANIGATQLPNLCLQLESAAKTGVVTADFQTMLDAIQVEAQKVEQMLQEYMQQF